MDFFPWVKDPILKIGLQGALSSVRMDPKTAATVVQSLAQEGEGHIKACVGEKFYAANFPTDRHGGPWKDGQPTGWVDHYTAAPSLRGTLMWFSSMDRGPNAGNSSAHFVIDRDGTIMTVVDPLSTIAWHATWTNATHIGVEHVNTGLLSKTGDQFSYWEGPYPAALVPGIQEVNGQYWEPFTVKQILSNLAIKRLLIMALPQLQRGLFTDHQAVDPKNKIDCGPMWPLQALNDLAFSFSPLAEEMDWMSSDVLTNETLAAFKAAVTALVSTSSSPAP